MEPIHGILFVSVMLLALLCDVRERRIPNWLTGTGLLLALLLGAARAGGLPAGALLGAGTGLLITLPLWGLGGIGGGDAKLIAVAGAFLGPSQLLAALAVTAVLGGVMAVISAIRAGVILPVLLRTKNLAVYLLTFGRFGSRGGRSVFSSSEAVTIPYGVAIALGGIAVWARPFLSGGTS